MMKKMLIALGIFLGFSLSAREAVTHFHSTIVVGQSSELSVTEAITVYAEGKQIRRGIVREFPTKYSSFWSRTTTSFELLGVWERIVQRDGTVEEHEVPYQLESAANGVVVAVGDDRFIEHGEHTYVVRYITNRQLGFFESHDELYWNVNGNGWRLPFDRITARVELPKQVPIHEIRAEAYTGFFGETGNDYRVLNDTQNPAVTFSTTRPFFQKEGLTIVVGWPKGYVHVPTIWEKAVRWMTDNCATMFALVWMLCAIIFFLFLLYWIRRGIVRGIVIPHFYPPKDMSAADVATLVHRKHTLAGFSAQIVQLAVQGYLTIEKEKNTYSLTRTNKQGEQKSYEQSILLSLFARSNRITVGKHDKAVAKAYAVVEYAVARRVIAPYFVSSSSVCFVYYLLLLVPLAVLMFVLPAVPVAFALYGAASLILFFLAQRFLWSYTQEGQRMREHVDGFLLFLNAAETERMQIVGTPPERTPALYETYLPYAIALGVEKRWTEQFVPIFERMARDGAAYHPAWMPMYGWHGGYYPHFSDSFGSAVSQSISAASSAPGSGSGFGGGRSGGGGFSGGGGGGGGGGGR